MEYIADTNFEVLSQNHICFTGGVKQSDIRMAKTSFIFEGKNNIVLFLGRVDKEIVLENSKINCKGNNNIIVISEGKFPVRCVINAGHGCVVHLGKNLWATTPVFIAANETKYAFIGDNALIAKNVDIRTSDMHMIYDIATKKRTNPAQDVYIGDHVWIGQDTGIMKGTVLGAGSIVGWGSLCSGKKLRYVNSIYVGRPAILTKSGITWRHRGSNGITEEDYLVHRYDEVNDDNFIYSQEEADQRYKEWESGITGAKSIEEKVAFIIKYNCYQK